MTATPLTPAELLPFETALTQRRLTITASARRMADTFAGVQGARSDGSTDSAHDAEASSLRTEWSRLSGFQGEFASELEAIDRALERIALGSYGICTRGGERIPAGRLEVRPASELCITCAEKVDAVRHR